MPRVSCPVCRKKLDLSPSKAVLGNRIHCPHCHALLEVASESPVRLTRVSQTVSAWDKEQERH